MAFTDLRQGLTLARRRALPVRVLTLFGLLLILGTLLSPWAPAVGKAVGPAPVVLIGLGAALSLRSALNRSLPATVRRAWLAMVVAFVALFVSGLSFVIAAGAAGGGVASSLVTTGYLARLVFAPAALFAIFSFPGPATSRHEWLMRGLDLMMVLGCGAMACWYFIAGPALQNGQVSRVALIGLGVPAANLALIGGAVIVIMRSGRGQHRRIVRHVVGGVLFLVIPDLSLAQQAVHGRINPQPTVTVSVFLLIGLLLLAVAAAEQVWEGSPAPDRGPEADPASAVSAQLPHVAVVVGYLLLLYAISRSDFFPWGGLVLGAITMTSGTLIRQVYALREQRRLATTDQMTGVANRSALLQAVRHAQDGAQRSGQLAAVLLLDLDGFKQVNDTLGHGTGDALLAEFAAVLRRNVLGRDVVGRLGGDEFAVVLHSLRDTRSAIAVADRILADLAEPARIGTHELHIATSIGITVTTGVGDTVAQALHRADEAMYEAKRAGGETWRTRLADHQPVTDGKPASQPA